MRLAAQPQAREGQREVVERLPVERREARPVVGPDRLAAERAPPGLVVRRAQWGSTVEWW